MKKKSIISISIVVLSIFFTTFFTPLTQAEEELNPQDQPASDEMTVYFIRKSGFVGGARNIWLASNEKVLASVASGSYCSFKVKSGPNIINVVQAKAPGGFFLLKYNPGEAVYLLAELMKGISQITREQGEEFIKKYRTVPILDKTEPNDALEFTLINPEFLKIELMKKTEENVNPDSDNAVITFIRPEKFIQTAPFGIWSKDGYLGSLKGYTYFQVKVKPGKHLFVGKAERISVVEAEVEAGKAYYIEFNTKMGWNMAHIQLIPVKKEIGDSTLQEWLKGSTHVTYDQNNVTNELKTVMDKSKVLIGEILKKVEKGEIESRKLLVEDAR